MVDFGSLQQQLNQIDSTLASSWQNAQGLQDIMQQLAQLKVTTPTSDVVGHAEIDKRTRALKEYQKVSKDTWEAERRSIEQTVSSGKHLLDLLERTILKHEGLRKNVYAVAGAYQTLKKEGDLGSAISQVSLLAGKYGILGVVIGQVISAAIKFQDRVQLVNKTIIDSTASTGNFAEGMMLAKDATLDMSVGLSKYAQQTGIATDRLQGHITALAALGFNLEEVGLDRTTGEVKTLTDAIAGQTGEWGALSTAIGVSRATGLDVTGVMQTMGVQVKTLGDSVADTAELFAQLSLSADRSSLSTQTLLPLVRSLQDQFKFLGIDSTAAAEALGRAGEVAGVAGTGAGAAVEVMSKAISGLGRMAFGQMAFFGQQMGMGGGLAAGFQFREQVGGKGGANLAVEIGKTIGNIMGGPGNIISEEQARANEQLAGIRLAQEQFTMQTLGMGQNEARTFLNIVEQLEQLEATGEGSSEKAEKLRDEIKRQQMGEAQYRASTLKAQEKIAQILELIARLVGRAVLTFVRAFAGAAAGEETEGFMSQTFGAISRGEGIDFQSKKFTRAMNKAFKGVDPIIEGFGKTLGSLFRLATTNVYTTIGSIIGGVAVYSILKRATIGLFSKVFSMQVLGGAVRGLFSGGGATVAGFGTAGRGAAGGVSGAIRSLAARFGGLARIAGTLTVGFAAAAAAAIATKAAMSHYTESVNRRVKGEEEATAASNRHLKQLNMRGAALEKITGLSNFEARSLLRRQRAGEELTEKERQLLQSKGEFVARQAEAEIMRVREFAMQAQGGVGATEGAINAGYIGGLGEELERSRAFSRRAQGQKKQQFQDALDVTKPGWLYASVGDVVVDAESLGEATGGMPGEAIGASRGGTATRGGPIERDVIINLKIMDEKIGQIAEEQIMISIEKDLVTPGKAGRSGLRHGKNKGYG